MGNYSIFVIGLLWRLNELINANCIKKCLKHCKHYINISYQYYFLPFAPFISLWQYLPVSILHFFVVVIFWWMAASTVRLKALMVRFYLPLYPQNPAHSWVNSCSINTCLINDKINALIKLRWPEDCKEKLFNTFKCT